MCLTNIDLKSCNTGGPYLDKKANLPKFGWKIFRHRDGYGPARIFGPTFSNQPIPYNQWVKDNKKGRIYQRTSTSFRLDYYPTGFHIFFTRKEARQFKKSVYNTNDIIRKVLFKDVVTIGIQEVNGFFFKEIYKCLVARSIKVLKDKV